jgi:hypothetical protein
MVSADIILEQIEQAGEDAARFEDQRVGGPPYASDA